MLHLGDHDAPNFAFALGQHPVTIVFLDPFPPRRASSTARVRWNQRPHRLGTLLVCLSLLLSTFGLSCSETASTQIVVLMDTDYAMPAEVDRIRARVAKVVKVDAGEKEVQTWLRVFTLSTDTAADPTAIELPATFSIIPTDEDLDREIVIELEALASGRDEVRVSRRLKTNFVRGEARLVRMLLYRACAGISCGGGETCGCYDGTSCTTPSCVDESIPPRRWSRSTIRALCRLTSNFPRRRSTHRMGAVSTATCR